MYHEFLLYLHIFGQVKIFDLRVVVERLDTQKEEEHIKKGARTTNRGQMELFKEKTHCTSINNT